MKSELEVEVEAYMQRLQPKNSGDNKGSLSLMERLHKDKAETNAPAQEIVLSNSQRWVMQLELMRKHMKSILMKHSTKEWSCMMPNLSYPLPKEEMEKVHNEFYKLELRLANTMMKLKSFLCCLSTHHIRPILVLFPRLCPQE